MPGPLFQWTDDRREEEDGTWRSMLPHEIPLRVLLLDSGH
jgi:hypothetical protein